MVDHMFLQSEDVLIPEKGDIGESTEARTEIIQDPVIWSKEDDASLPWTWIAGGVVIFLVLAIAAAVRRRRKRKKGAQTDEMWSAKPVEPVRTTVEPDETGVSVASLQHIGSRESQQDCFAVSPMELFAEHGLLAVVADGMGGLKDGDKVSQLVVSSMMEGFANINGLPQAVLMTLTGQANLQVNRMLGSNVGRSGSTVVAGLVRNGLFHYLSVGDSRICLYRNGQLLQLNREHVYRNDLAVHAMNGSGELMAALTDPRGGGLTSYIGMGQLKYVDIPAQPVKIQTNDKFILMSDGVCNALTDPELAEALCAEPEQAAEKIGNMIAAKALRHQDNYTAVILGF